MQNRNYLCFLLCLLFLAAGCTSSKKLLEKGKYDKAIEKSAKKLRKDPGDAEELAVLREAYRQANTFDQERIDFLRKEDREENWLEIYYLYSELESRQDVIRSLPTGVRNQFRLVDYDEKIIQSKQSAAEAMYRQGLEYLDRGDRESARLAYDEFSALRNIYPDYKNVVRLQNEARYLGTNFVLLQLRNNSGKVLPEYFVNEFKKISLADLNSRWVQFDSYADSSRQYDFYVVLNLQQIATSPESIEKHSYTERREVQDGMKYLLDENGNVRKDSLGNDIRVPKMITVSARITESVQQKQAMVEGTIDYIDMATDQLVKTEKISVNADFQHFSAVFQGDGRALSDDSRKKIGNEPVPFPTDEAMLMDAVALLKDRAKRIIARNRNLLSSSDTSYRGAY